MFSCFPPWVNVRGHHGFDADRETMGQGLTVAVCTPISACAPASATALSQVQASPARVRRDDAGVSSASAIVKPLLALPAALWRRILPISSAVLPSPAMRRGVARGERADAVGRGKGRKAWRPDLTAAATALPSAAPGNPEKGSVLPKAID